MRYRPKVLKSGSNPRRTRHLWVPKVVYIVKGLKGLLIVWGCSNQPGSTSFMSLSAKGRPLALQVSNREFNSPWGRQFGNEVLLVA